MVIRRETVEPMLPMMSTPNTPTITVRAAEADGREVEREAQGVPPLGVDRQIVQVGALDLR